jgi:hypothetical protein
MSYHSVVDDAARDFGAIGTFSKPGWPGSRPITTGFNLALFVYHAVIGILGFAVGRASGQGLSLEAIQLTSAIDTVRFAVVILISAFFLKEFWARLISSVAAIRPITYAEAIAILLMIGILVGG